MVKQAPVRQKDAGHGRFNKEADNRRSGQAADQRGEHHAGRNRQRQQQSDRHDAGQPPPGVGVVLAVQPPAQRGDGLSEDNRRMWQARPQPVRIS